jgi:AraC-like DNA-binding protein
MDVGAHLVERTSTLRLDARERAEFWSQYVRTNHCSFSSGFADASDFRARTVLQRGPRHQMVEFWSQQIHYVRSVKDVARDDDYRVRVLVPLAGSMLVRVGDQDVRLHPGAAGLLATAHPFEIRHGDGVRALVFTLPDARPDIPPRPVLDLRTGLGAVAHNLLTGIAAESDRFGPGEFERAATGAAEMLRQLATPSTSGSLYLVEQAFRAYVAEHAANPELTGGSAAAALGWSLRQVQVALKAADTTPSEVIRRERLTLARRLLGDGRLRISDVAFASGFSSVNTFTDAFRREFGATPRSFRS